MLSCVCSSCARSRRGWLRSSSCRSSRRSGRCSRSASSWSQAGRSSRERLRARRSSSFRSTSPSSVRRAQRGRLGLLDGSPAEPVRRATAVPGPADGVPVRGLPRPRRLSLTDGRRLANSPRDPRSARRSSPATRSSRKPASTRSGTATCRWGRGFPRSVCRTRSPPISCSRSRSQRRSSTRGGPSSAIAVRARRDDPGTLPHLQSCGLSGLPGGAARLGSRHARPARMSATRPPVGLAALLCRRPGDRRPGSAGARRDVGVVAARRPGLGRRDASPRFHLDAWHVAVRIAADHPSSAPARRPSPTSSRATAIRAPARPRVRPGRLPGREPAQRLSGDRRGFRISGAPRLPRHCCGIRLCRGESGATGSPLGFRLALVAILAASAGHLVTDAFMTADVTGTWLFWVLMGAGLGVLSAEVAGPRMTVRG